MSSCVIGHCKRRMDTEMSPQSPQCFSYNACLPCSCNIDPRPSFSSILSLQLAPTTQRKRLSSMHTIMRSSVELPSRLAIIWRLQVCVVVSHDSLCGCSIIVNDIFRAIWWFHHLMDRKVMMTRRFLNTQNISVFSWEAGWKQQT